MESIYYYKKHSNTFDTDFTANMAPATISNPEEHPKGPHRRH